MTDGEDHEKIQRSNRATIIIFGLVMAVFVGPALFRIGRYLLDLI